MNITSRQARLGSELRNLREAAGLSTREVSLGLKIDATKISHIEAGRTGLSASRLRLMAAYYGCEDAALIDALAAMTGDRPRNWWEDFRGDLGQSALNLAELEHHAVELRTIQGAYIPGLLQTEAYMRGVMSYPLPYPTKPDLDIMVAFRLRRQRILDRLPTLPFRAVIHEAALRTHVADRAATREQLDSILADSERDNVAIRVVPFQAYHFGAGGTSILHARGPVPRLDTVTIDALTGTVWLDDESQLAEFRALLDKVNSSALSVTESRSLITRLIREL
ncbi:transcriptional regulator WhiJ [Streptomyces mayteni]